MKKGINSFLFTIMFILLFSINASASSNTYTISEMGLDVTIPYGYQVITKDTPANASIFNDLGVTKADLIEQFEVSSIYLNAISDTFDDEIVVTMENNIIDNFSAFSDTTLKTLASLLIGEYEAMGINILEYDIYQHSQAKFVRIYFEDAANFANGLQYYTIYNGKAMNFTMWSYSGELSETQEETIKNIVDSIKYDTAPVAAPSAPETDAFIYTDTETNTKFTVPANWYEKELFEDREFIDVKFVSSKEEGMSIMYGSTDLWGMLTAEEQEGSVRSDLDNSFFTLEEMAIFLGVNESEVSRVKYNGVEYYQAAIKNSAELYGLDFTVEMTQMVRLDNGWLYLVQFSGTPDNPYFTDFETLLNSVEYANNSSVELLNPEIKSTKGSADSSALWGVIIVVLLIGIVVVAVWYVRKSKEQKAKHLNAELSEDRISNFREKVNCPNCGIELAQDSLFCHICGTKIFKEDNDV